MKKNTLLAMIALLGMLNFRCAAIPFRWQPANHPPDEQILGIYPSWTSNGLIFACGESGKIFRSSNWGDSWEAIGSPDGRKTVLLQPDTYRKNHIYAVTSSDGPCDLWFSETNGTGWTHLFTANSPILSLAASPHVQSLLLAVFKIPSSDQSGLFYSVDNGMNWTQVLSGSANMPAPVWHPTSPWEAYWGTYRSVDYGRTWSEVTNNQIYAANTAIPPILFNVTSAGVFASFDDVISWWPLLYRPADFISLNKREPSQILTGASYHSVPVLYFSDDGGDHFYDWNDGLPGQVSFATIISDWLMMAVSNGTIYVYDETPADLDGSNRIDGGDLVILSMAFGTQNGDARFNPIADLNQDGVVDGNDLTILAMVWGHPVTYPDLPPPENFSGTN